jgi:biotin transporter BioY
MGRMADSGLARSFRTSLLPFVVGTLAIQAFGVAWLSTIVGGPVADIRFGLLPFLFGAPLTRS